MNRWIDRYKRSCPFSRSKLVNPVILVQSCYIACLIQLLNQLLNQSTGTYQGRSRGFSWGDHQFEPKSKNKKIKDKKCIQTSTVIKCQIQACFKCTFCLRVNICCFDAKNDSAKFFQRFQTFFYYRSTCFVHCHTCVTLFVQSRLWLNWHIDTVMLRTIVWYR